MARTPRPAVRVRVVDLSGSVLEDASVDATPSGPSRLPRWRVAMAQVCRDVCQFFGRAACSTTTPLGFDAYWRIFTAPLPPGLYTFVASAPGLATDQRVVSVGADGVHVTFVLGRAGLPYYYRSEMRVPFEHHDVCAIALRRGYWERGLAALLADSGLSLRTFDAETLPDVGPVRAKGIELVRVPPSNRAAFEAAIRRQRFVRAAGVVVASSSRSVGFLTGGIVFQLGERRETIISIEAAGFTLTRLRSRPNRYLSTPRADIDSLAALAAANQLASRFTDVQWVEPNLFATLLPNSPTGAAGASVAVDQPHHALIQTPAAWLQSTGKNTVIAIIDGGCDTAHPDLAPKIIAQCNPGADPLANPQETTAQVQRWTHGTQCAGIAAGTRTIDGLSGVAPDAKLVIVQKEDDDDVNFADAFRWCGALPTHRQDLPPAPAAVDVISCSWNTDVFAAQEVIDAFRDLESRGITVVFSSGDFGDTAVQGVIGKLASYETNIAVGASSTYPPPTEERRASDSSYGDALDIVAPAGGRDIVRDGFTLATVLVGDGALTSPITGATIDYGLFNQTSCAAPQVAGVVALMRSIRPGLAPAVIRDILSTAVAQIPDPSAYANGFNEQYGYGRVDAAQAVSAARAWGTST